VPRKIWQPCSKSEIAPSRVCTNVPWKCINLQCFWNCLSDQNLALNDWGCGVMELLCVWQNNFS
jgi:hypothetical protein